MRADNEAFAQKNASPEKDPRFVVELSFDSDNQIVRYIQSHADAALPAGATAFGRLSRLSITSQGLNPDTANATIGAITYRVLDKASAATQLLGDQLDLGRSTRRQRTRAYAGYEGLPWSDYQLVQTQLVDSIAFDRGEYDFRCADVQREMRSQIFDLAATNLAVTLIVGATTVEVYNTAAFLTLAHGVTYSDAPNATVGYIRIENEIIRYTGKTSTTFTGCTRGALNTLEVEHKVDPNATQDRRTKVEEYVYLEMPAVKLAAALLTGKVYGTENRLLRSREFSNASWFKSGQGTASAPTITDNYGVAPDGSTTAARAQFNLNGGTSTNDISNLGQTFTYTGVDNVFDIWIKSNTGASQKLGIFNENNQLETTVTPEWKRFPRIRQTGFSGGSSCGVRLRGGFGMANTADVLVWEGQLVHGITSLPNATTTSAARTGDVLPTKWHLGISTDYVRLTDFFNIGDDLWNRFNDEKCFVVRGDGLTKTDGKRFIETELMLLLGAFMPVYADGALGFRRMSNVLAGAAYVRMLDESSIVSHGELLHDFGALHNVIQFDWNWEPIQNAFTRQDVLVDGDSLTIHGGAEALMLKFRLLHGSRHSAVTLAKRFDAIRDRYTGPPLRLDVVCKHHCNNLEVGDVVRVRLANVRDFVANGPLDRSFEVQNVTIDWITGRVALRLFASSQAPGALPATPDTTVLPNNWYTAAGTNLASVLTITGSNPAHVTGGGTLNGSGDMNAAASIFYFDGGDLIVDAGVTIALNGNVQLRNKGFFTNNGTINGAGNGHSGAAAVASPSTDTEYNVGTAGFIGSTQAGGGIQSRQGRIGGLTSYVAPTLVGANANFPGLNIGWDGTTLSGIPTDLRGTSGSSGLPATNASNSTRVAGGAGGDGGAGLAIICRGFAQGVSAYIDLGGAAGAVGPTLDGGDLMYAGSGAGGAPGGMLILLDGTQATATQLGEAQVRAVWGATPIPAEPLPAPISPFLQRTVYSYYVGTGDGVRFALPSLSGARGGHRVQYVPGTGTVAPDPPAEVLQPPSSLGLVSSGEALPPNTDGTVVPRIKATWNASPDPRTLGYEFQFKRSSDSIWTDGPFVRGISAGTVWISPVRSGITYDVRIRAAGDVRRISTWLTVTGHMVAGDTTAPANVTGLAFDAPFATWSPNGEDDLMGYVVKYKVGDDSNPSGALAAHTEGFITPAEFNTLDLLLLDGDLITLFVWAIDLTGNLSASPATLLLRVTDIQLHELMVSNWTVQTHPATQLNGVTWGGTFWCAVGAQNGTNADIITSPNGKDWTARSNPKNVQLNAVAYSGAMLCAVGDADGTDAYIVTSTDGVTWTERANPKNKDLRGIAHNGSVWCAVGGLDGTDAYIVTSTDGVTWTERANPDNNTLNAVAWNGTVFLAIGETQGAPPGLAYAVSSPTGTTWTKRDTPRTVPLYGLAWDGAIFCGVGKRVTEGSSLKSYLHIISSHNGTTLTLRNNSQIDDLFAIAWNGMYFCAVGGKVLTSMFKR